MKTSLKLYESITIVVDTRERCPHSFNHPTVAGTLATGDYSILGFEDKVSVEKKSVDDLVGCLKDEERKKFEKELQRSRTLDYFSVVIEASLSDLTKGNYRSSISPASVVQNIIALSVRHRIPVRFAETREMGQRITESLLEKYARDLCKRFEAFQRMTEENHAA